MDNHSNETWRRISACPLHFLWDGRGSARKLVRFGFMALMGGMVLYFGDKLWPALDLNRLAKPTLLFGVLIWIYGQVRSFLILLLAKK